MDMKTTNFTVAGERVQVIARFDGAYKPVYDLIIGDEEVAHGVGYDMLEKVCTEIVSELEQLFRKYTDAGMMLDDYNTQWSKREGESDDA